MFNLLKYRAGGLFLVIFLLVAAPVAINAQEPAKGRWDGNLSFDAGTNFDTEMSSRTFSRSSGVFSLWSRYRTEKFMVKLDFQGLGEFAASTVNGQTISLKNPDAPELNYDITQKENTVFDEKAGLLMEYEPDRKNKFSFNVGQRFNRQTPDKAGISIGNHFNSDNYEDVVISCSFDLEEVLQKQNTVDASAKWNHKFDKQGRCLDAGIGWGISRNDKSSVWQITPASGVMIEDDRQEESAPTHTFRVTPLITENSVNASVTYRDVDLFGVKSLNLDAGVDFKAGIARDRQSAANLVDEVWVDSLSYRVTFNFLSFNAVPKAKISFSPGRFKFNLQIANDFYASKLTDDKNTGTVTYNKYFFLPSLDATWTPSGKHKVGVSYNHGMTRPTYLQICWFPRVGAYANELIVGNPTLKPGSSGRASLFYTFQSGFFTGTVEEATTFNWDKIEKVFYTAEDSRIITWINSGHSMESNVKLTLKANLKNFEATLGGNYNYFIGYNSAGNATRSSDWGVNADATLRVKGGWTFNAKGRYQSKIIRTYNSITAYVGCDVRVAKDFKRFSIFLQGKDLFDQTIQIVTYSEDQTYARIEDNYYNRRIFSVGASFKF